MSSQDASSELAWAPRQLPPLDSQRRWTGTAWTPDCSSCLGDGPRLPAVISAVAAVCSRTGGRRLWSEGSDGVVLREAAVLFLCEAGELPAWVRQLRALHCQHAYGENNTAADAASRRKWEVLRQVAEQLGHRLQRVEVTAEAIAYLNRVLAAIGLGVHVEPPPDAVDAAAPGCDEAGEGGAAEASAAAGESLPAVALATAAEAAAPPP